MKSITLDYQSFMLLIIMSIILALIAAATIILYTGHMIHGFSFNKTITDNCASIIFDEHSVGYNKEYMSKYCLKITWNYSK